MLRPPELGQHIVLNFAASRFLLRTVSLGIALGTCGWSPMIPAQGQQAKTDRKGLPPTSNVGRPRPMPPQLVKVPDSINSKARASRPKTPVDTNYVDAKAKEVAFWQSIKNSNNIEDFRRYVLEYPSGDFVGLANNRIRSLMRAGARLDQSTGKGDAATRVVEISGVRFDFVIVQPGSFSMGSMNGEHDERVMREVTISRPFEIMECEVTQWQWEALVGSNPSVLTGPDLPVTNVSYEDTAYFIAEMNRGDSVYAYRLPTEAEWEFACRAGSTGDWGGYINAMAWYGDNSGEKKIDAESIWKKDSSRYLERLTNNGCHVYPVGEKKPNAWGLYDMHGNVWEWCQDWYGPYPIGSATDPVGPSDGSFRVWRGGSWFNTANDCRSSARFWGAPDVRLANVGFRLVRTAR